MQTMYTHHVTRRASGPFIYTGQLRDDIPRNVRHVKVVDPAIKEIGYRAFKGCTQLRNVELSEGLERIVAGAFEYCESLVRIAIPSTVKVIGAWTFQGCSQLRDVELHEGLVRIEDWAFGNCTSLERIIIPSTIKDIDRSAFDGCTQLMNVELCEGLEWIDYAAFWGCSSLESITIPSTVKKIGGRAFKYCDQLVSVELNEGLEQIERGAFAKCSSLRHIRIPSTVKKIGEDAFKDCDNLSVIEFCNETEQLVNETSLHWWSQGVSKASLKTYTFLARCNIPARLDQIKFQTWKENVHNMLRRIPEELKDDNSDYDSSDEQDDSQFEEDENTYYFDLIESRLANYEHLRDDVAPALELALWKSKILEQSNSNHLDGQMKFQCRCDSLSMISIIIPNALRFL